MPVVPINYLAVLACGVVAMILGSLWYGPFFGKPWMAMMGMQKPAQMDAAMKKAMMRSYSLMFVTSLIMAYVLAHATIFAAAYTKTSGVAAGLMSGFWNWLGFIVPISLGSVLWERKPWKLWYINVGYWLAQLLIMGVILAVWS